MSAEERKQDPRAGARPGQPSARNARGTQSGRPESPDPRGAAPGADGRAAADLRCPSMWSLNWFLSRTVRHATQMCKHVRKLVNAQRDLLDSRGIAAIGDALARMREAIAGPRDREKLTEAMHALDEVANKWLRPYPNAGIRENIEVLLVALAVAMGIRTFFLQPFKIPTGSMQPTLYGITHENLIDRPDVEIPNPVTRFFLFWTKGVSYVHVVARSDGELREVLNPTRFLLFNLKQRILIGDEWYTIWFPPEELPRRAGLLGEPGYSQGRTFKKGEDIIKLRVVSGDHLFVDRLTYNFRHPKRGEIVVFQTSGIDDPRVPKNQYYIKRLIGLPNEDISIDATDHVVINGRRLTASDPGFENLYGYWPDGRYVGHVHAPPFFSTPDKTNTIGSHRYMVMGDNTRNSLDSRYWGDLPQESVIGKAYFVYWPISERFGWGHGR